MSELLGPERKKELKRLIMELHQGASVEEVKGRFKELVRGLSPEDIARLEEELIEEGLPREEIQRLCDVHIEVFKDVLKESGGGEEWHPISILMKEHEIQLSAVESLVRAAGDGRRDAAVSYIDHLLNAENHYLREENVLFPYLEKHGIKEPPAIMWMEHDEIRELKKELKSLNGMLEGDEDVFEKVKKVGEKLKDVLSSHFFKENNILFPTAEGVIEEREWIKIREEFDDIGYCCYTPPPLKKASEEMSAVEEGRIRLPTGSFTLKELQAVLNTLPFEVTFVDKDDRVRYFNDRSDMVFLRTKAILGRTVQRCHPKKSIDVVNRILEDFRGGRRDVAEFWIDFRGRFIHIRYFAVRGEKGEYLGTLEVTQDVTEIRKLEGERRLLDE